MTSRTVWVLCALFLGAMTLGAVLVVTASRRAHEARIAELETRVASLSSHAPSRASEAPVELAAESPSAGRDSEEDTKAAEPAPETVQPSTAYGETVAELAARVAALEAVVRALQKDPLGRGFEYLASQNPALRREGIKLLDKIAREDPDAREAIAGLLEDPDPKVRSRAIETLAGMKALGVPELARWLEDPDRNVREEALRALRDSRDPGAAAPLRAFYEQHQGKEGLEAALALKQLGDGQPLEREIARLLQVAAKGEVESERLDALELLAKHARDTAQNVLMQALDDPSPRVREKAQRLLEKKK